MKTFLIYGSYGYTGKLIVDLAVQRGIKPILAGRDEKRLRAQAADPWGCSATPCPKKRSAPMAGPNRQAHGPPDLGMAPPEAWFLRYDFRRGPRAPTGPHA